MPENEIKTSFENKCHILATLWMEYRDDESFSDYISYNDLGLPMAYMIENGLVEIEDGSIGANFVNEAFRLLLSGLDIEEDLCFEELDDVLEAAEGDNGLPAADEEDEEDSLVSARESVWDEGYDSGWSSGVTAEQDRIQSLCRTYSEMYLDQGKGQKAVFWREAADALKPTEELAPYDPEGSEY